MKVKGLIFSHNYNNLWIGYNIRTDIKSHNEVKSIFKKEKLNIKVISLKLISKKYYHLDLCFCLYMINIYYYIKKHLIKVV